MALSPAQLKPVADAIGAAFSLADAETVVRNATGEELYKRYAGPNDPLQTAIRRALEALIEEGNERWLLIGALVMAAANESLRRTIVRAAPETLAALPSVDEQVGRALQGLGKAKAMMLSNEFRHLLKPSRDRLSTISGGIRTLSAFKDLHESLHGLHLKLAFRLAAESDDRALVDALEQAVAKAPQSAASLPDANAERAWIDELDRSAKTLRAAVSAANPAPAANLDQVQRLVRRQLARLNAMIFAAADKLSLAELIEVVPDELEAEADFIELDQAIRDLKATVIARVFVHKIWQDADNELSLIQDVLRVPATSSEQSFANWLGLYGRVRWLASLEPDAEWAKLALSTAETIEAELTRNEKRDDAVKPPFETLCRILKFRFFAVDANLKADCHSLGKFHEPLKLIVEEIGNG